MGRGSHLPAAARAGYGGAAPRVHVVGDAQHPEEGEAEQQPRPAPHPPSPPPSSAPCSSSRREHHQETASSNRRRRAGSGGRGRTPAPLRQSPTARGGAGRSQRRRHGCSTPGPRQEGRVAGAAPPPPACARRSMGRGHSLRGVPAAPPPGVGPGHGSWQSSCGRGARPEGGAARACSQS